MARNRKNRRIIVITLIALVVIGMGYCVVASKKVKPTIVETAKVSRETIVETVNASGKVQPVKEVKITADISGEIIDLPVKEGDHVKKGQLLVRIKPDQYQRGVEKADAGVNSAKASLANAKAAMAQSKANMEKIKIIYNRNKGLLAQKAISQADYDNSEADYKVAMAQIDATTETAEGAKFALTSAIASAKEAKDALQKTEIFSPIEGTISKLNRVLGERIVGMIQMEGTEVMRVAQLNTMEVQADVNENDIVRLKLGDSADVEVDAYRGQIFKGIITDIASSTSSATLTNDKVTNFTVKIRLQATSYKSVNSEDKNMPTPFRPGMSASVAIYTKKVENVMAVPISAAAARNKKTKDSSGLDKQDIVVFLLQKDNTVKECKVKTGIQNDAFIEIKEGLKGDEEIISGPFTTVSKDLKDGDKVERSKGKGKKDKV